MNNDVKIEALKFTGEHIDELSELLIQVVEDGASIGFLLPLNFSLNAFQTMLNLQMANYMQPEPSEKSSVVGGLQAVKYPQSVYVARSN